MFQHTKFREHKKEKKRNGESSFFNMTRSFARYEISYIYIFIPVL